MRILQLDGPQTHPAPLPAMKPELQILELPRQTREIDRFLKVSYGIYASDPHWVAPLLADLRKVFTNANPLFEHAEMRLWVAVRDGRDVGRIAGVIDRHHIQQQPDKAAFFGFFECLPDPTISGRLLETVADWARQRNLDRLLGPMNPTTNDECGLLVAGFDGPPVIMMTYNPRYYIELLEQAGFRKEKDLLAFDFDVKNSPLSRIERIAQTMAKRLPDITVRPIRKRSLEADLAKVKTVYNASWEENWGFVPMTDAEINFMAERLKPLLMEGLVWLAENRAGPVGFLLALPDYNEAIQPLRGRLCTPRLGGFLLHLMGWRCPSRVRVIAFGVKKEFRGRGIESMMLAGGLRFGFQKGFRRVEASWILEDNANVRRVIELFGGQPYRTYRIYARAVAGSTGGK
jgi:GNAT superfamily N-acetyltransferase